MAGRASAELAIALLLRLAKEQGRAAAYASVPHVAHTDTLDRDDGDATVGRRPRLYRNVRRASVPTSSRDGRRESVGNQSISTATPALTVISARRSRSGCATRIIVPPLPAEIRDCRTRRRVRWSGSNTRVVAHTRFASGTLCVDLIALAIAAMACSSVGETAAGSFQNSRMRRADRLIARQGSGTHSDGHGRSGR